MKYQDNMTPAELTQFKKELDELDAAYAAAAEHDAGAYGRNLLKNLVIKAGLPLEEWEDEMELITKAALNRGRP